MIKKCAIALVLAFGLLFSGCNVVDSVLNGGDSLLKSSDVDVYGELDSLISTPSRSSNLTGSFKFVCYIASEPFEMEFDDDEKLYMYQEVYIERNINKPIFVDVTDLKETLPANSYATITAKLDGSVSWTQDNKRETVLSVIASKTEAFTPSDAEPDVTNKLSLAALSYKGDFEFVGAHYSKNALGDVIVVYFNFTNRAADTNTKMSGVGTLLGQIDAYQGDILLSSVNSVLSPDELDPGALSAGDMQAYTPSGKTLLYYTLYRVDAEAAGEPMYFDVMDDSFAWTNSVEVPIAASLAEMNK